MKKISQQTIIKDFEEKIFIDTINKITSKNFEEKVLKIEHGECHSKGKKLPSLKLYYFSH